MHTEAHLEKEGGNFGFVENYWSELEAYIKKLNQWQLFDIRKKNPALMF